jgi:hypothetical protein
MSQPFPERRSLAQGWSGVWWQWTLLVLLALVGMAPPPAAAQPDLDPPGRVGRIADLAGGVWWFDLEQGQWSEALHNRPVTAGDRLSTGRDGRAELRIGSTSIKLAESTEVELLRLDDERVRVQLHRGSIALRLRSREVAAETEFGTDEAWLQPRRGGLYRLDREDDTSFAASWRGELQVVDMAGLTIDAGRRLQLWREGPGGELHQRWSTPLDDAFAARVLREDSDDERSASAAYVSPEMTGWEDLDRYGRWDRHPEYGAVWLPLAVRDDWAPYRQGHWSWVRPWGWTWVDDAPWGFAPYHYGRWVSWRGRWCWVPGSYVARPVYAPALVAWIDGPAVGIGIRVGGPTLSWVPLAPWEPFRPHYRVSPGYHDRVNPPDLHRWRPPPRGRGQERGFGNEAVPGAVTVVPSDVLRRRPPPGLREGRDEPPRLPLPDRSERRPGHERPVAPVTVQPLPTRPQPVVTATPAAPPQPVQPLTVQPAPTVIPRRPVNADGEEPGARRPVRPGRDEARSERPSAPRPAEPPLPRPQPVVVLPRQPAAAPPASPPPAAAPRAPSPAPTRAPVAREREPDDKRDEGRGRPAEPRGAQRP